MLKDSIHVFFSVFHRGRGKHYIGIIGVLVMWMICATVIQAQTVTIIDKDTKKPLSLVILISEHGKISAVTNAQGQADVSAFHDEEKILIRSLGYKSVTISYTFLHSVEWEIFLEPSNLNLDEVVISATKWRQMRNDVPSMVISISPKDMEIQNPQTAADLLGFSGKVFIQKSQQGGGSPMIRGFATNRLLYAVDGVRMNNAIFRGGNIQNVINLDPFATENTEVLFGPGSVIYGSDAIGGVMSFQTLTPQFSLTDKPLLTGKAVTRYASANSEKTGHFDINIGWEKLALVTSFSRWDYDHLRQGSHGPDDYLKPFYVERHDSMDVVIFQDDELLQKPSAYSQINLMQKIRFRPNSGTDIQYGFHYSETSSYGRYDRHNRIRNGNPRYAEWKYGPQKWMMNYLNCTFLNDGILFDQVSLRMAQQSFEESRIDRSLNSWERNATKENVNAYSVNLDLTKQGKKNSIFYGVEYVFNDIQSSGEISDISTGIVTSGPSRYPESGWTSVAAYINDDIKISEDITLQAGLRYNLFILKADFTKNLDFYPFPFRDTELKDDAVTGSLGLVYRPSKSWVIKGNFGTAFRSPNVDDMGKVFDSEPGSVTVPNPDLEAEYAYNIDLGAAKVIGDHVKIDITVFYTSLRNALVRRDYSMNGIDSILYEGVYSSIQAVQNAAEARVYGIQTGLEIKLHGGFSISTDWNFQDGEEELDDGTLSTSRHAAPVFGTGRISYHAEKLYIQIYSSYQGERRFEDMPEEERGKDEIYAKDTNGNNYAPSWYTINIKTLYDLTDNLSITAGVENLTDQRYRPYSSGISAPGRNFILSLRADF